jgi:chromosome segregation protein
MLKRIEIAGFKSFEKKTVLDLGAPVSAIVGPNGSGKSNVAEALRWVLGEQSMKSMRGKRGEDLIFNGSKTVAQQNRASVSISFDNSARRFPVDFSEVVITREVFRDGANRYAINGTLVRLKDVLELLAAVGIGGTSYHIISQGEADRLLMARPEMRREIIEEALGLNVYQYKKTESEKNLGKVEENLREAVAMRRELLPQLRFLKGEIEKLDRLYAVRDELTAKYQEYFAHESAHMAREQEEVAREKEFWERKRGEYADPGAVDVGTNIFELRQEKEKLTRELGRIEGVLAAAKTHAEHFEVEEETAPEKSSAEDFSGAVRACVACGQELPEQLIAEMPRPQSFSRERTQIFDIEALLAEKTAIEEKLSVLESAITKAHEFEQAQRELSHRRRDIEQGAAQHASHERELLRRHESFRFDLADAVERVGRFVLGYDTHPVSVPDDAALAREHHATRRQQLERLKIRHEELGAPDENVRKEYEDLAARDSYFSREIDDLKNAAQSLRQMAADVDLQMQSHFSAGISKINKEFQTFFTALFGGGEASLSPILVSDEGEPEQYGLDIAVSMPHKKVKSLQLLSGGERSLASIALLFAMSQVNPPPFLVLDETDAALDESNSRRYGDLISRLAERSQLIIITHNRETMARSHILYGITMGGDGTSRVLSVKLDK